MLKVVLTFTAVEARSATTLRLQPNTFGRAVVSSCETQND